MKILKHGTALRFYCDGCGCEWIANEKECQTQTKYESCMACGKEYTYQCPECGIKTVGYHIEADDNDEL